MSDEIIVKLPEVEVAPPYTYEVIDAANQVAQAAVTVAQAAAITSESDTDNVVDLALIRLQDSIDQRNNDIANIIEKLDKLADVVAAQLIVNEVDEIIDETTLEKIEEIPEIIPEMVPEVLPENPQIRTRGTRRFI